MARHNLNLAPEVLGGPVAEIDEEAARQIERAAARQRDWLQARLSARYCRCRTRATEAREGGDAERSLRLLAAATHLRYYQAHGYSVRRGGGLWRA